MAVMQPARPAVWAEDGTIKVPGVQMSTQAAELFVSFLHVNKELDLFQRGVLKKVLGNGNSLESIKSVIRDINNKCFQLRGSGWSPEKGEGDMVLKPNHYERFPMEPTYFIVMAGGFHWCIENFIKYIVRFPFKNGLEDLRKAARNLSMYVAHQEGDEAWSR